MVYRNVIKDLKRIGLGDHWLIQQWEKTYRPTPKKKQLVETPLSIREHFVQQHDVTHDDIIEFDEDQLSDLHTTFPECNFKTSKIYWKSVTSSFKKHAPYGIPKEKGGDSPKNVERMERCVNKLMEEGHDKSSAIAICKNNLGFTKNKRNKESSWKSVHYAKKKKRFRDETFEEFEQRFDKQLANFKTQEAETTQVYDSGWDFVESEQEQKVKDLPLFSEEDSPIRAVDTLNLKGIKEHIKFIRSQDWFKDAFHPMFHELKIKPQTLVDLGENVTGQATIKNKNFGDLSEAINFDPSKEVLRKWHYNKLKRFFDRRRFQINDKGLMEKLMNPSKTILQFRDVAPIYETIHHELAHALTPGHGHNSEFRGVNLYLTKNVIGDEAFHKLRKEYLKRGLRSTFKSLNRDKLDSDFVSVLEEDQKQIDAGVMYKKSSWKSVTTRHSSKLVIPNYFLGILQKISWKSVMAMPTDEKFLNDIVFDYSNENSDHTLKAYHPSFEDYIGHITWNKDNGEILSLAVDPQNRRKGLATLLWNRAREIDPNIQHSIFLTESGFDWLKSLKDEKSQSLLENWDEINDSKEASVKSSASINKKLWLDDVRPAPEGWNHFTTAYEAIDALNGGGYTHISLDHDLGPESAGTGYNVVQWIEEQYYTNPDFKMPEWKVHSANPVGRERMERVLEKLKPTTN